MITEAEADGAVRVMANATKALVVVARELSHISRLLTSPIGADGQVCDDARIKIATLTKFAGAYRDEVMRCSKQLEELGIMK